MYNMFAYILLLVAGLLALPGWSFSTPPPTTAPSDTVSDCTSWVVAHPSDDCKLLARNSFISLDQLLSYNPSLRANCSTTVGYSYCVEKKLEVSSEGTTHKGLAKRDDRERKMGILIQYLYLVEVTSPLLTIVALWNDRIVPRFESLSYADLADWLRRSPEGQDLRVSMVVHEELGTYIGCNLPTINDSVGKWRSSGTLPFKCTCYGTSCCAVDEVCPALFQKRLEQSTWLDRNINLSQRVNRRSAIEPRAPSYTWAASIRGQTYSGTYTSIAWPGPSAFNFTSWIWQNVFTPHLFDDCTQLTIQRYPYSSILQRVRSLNLGYDELDFAQTEHYVEKNAFAKFTEDCIKQKLPSGVPFVFAAPIPPTFFSVFMATNVPYLQNIPSVPGAQMVVVPKDRIMHTLGSTANRDNFMLLFFQLNNMKEGILKGDNPIADSAIQYLMTNRPHSFLIQLRMVFNTLSYLNDPIVLSKAQPMWRAIRWEWYNYQREYAQSTGIQYDIVEAWDEWYLDYMQTRMSNAEDWLIKWATDGHTHWKDDTTPDGMAVRDVCAYYKSSAEGLRGFNSQGYPTGTPTAPP